MMQSSRKCAKVEQIRVSSEPISTNKGHSKGYLIDFFSDALATLSCNTKLFSQNNEQLFLLDMN